MNIREFSIEFDLAYNNIPDISSPGINEYEKSVLLTKAQEQVVFNIYNPKGNKYQEGYENSEQRRRDLGSLINTFITSDSYQQGLNANSLLIEIPEEILFIVNEQVKVEGEIDNNLLNVIPITHDEYNLQIRNPFRKPSANRRQNIAWRMDRGRVNEERVIELILPENVELIEYVARYIAKLEPIVLTDLTDGEFTGLNLSIDGFTLPTECQLDNSLHRRILDRAVDLALEYTQQQRLQSHAQLAQRNE